MFGGLPKNAALYLFQVPIYGENMQFCQKISQIKKQTISDLFLLKNSISVDKNSLKCNNFGQFHFFIVFIQIKIG